MSRALSGLASIDRFVAAVSEVGYPPKIKTRLDAQWSHDRPLPLDIGLKAVEVCGLEAKVIRYPDAKWVDHAQLLNRGCGCAPADKPAILSLTCFPPEFVG